MKKILFVLLAAVTLFSCGGRNDELKKSKEEIKENQLDVITEGIISSENKGLPMTIQKMEGVKNITIDKLIIVNNTDPYYGYLATTWEIYERHECNLNECARNNYEPYTYTLVTKNVNVEVTHIHGEGGKYEWRTDWYSAYQYAREEQLGD